MKFRVYVVIALGVAALVVLLYVLIPSGLGIKGQLRWFLDRAIWLVTLAIGFVLWLLEVVVLVGGPWFLGWFGRWGIQKADETLTPDQDLTKLQGTLLNLLLVAVMFLSWIFVALAATWLPPISNFFPGPWIRSYIETGLVWWGAYAALAYMLFPPMRSFVKFASY